MSGIISSTEKIVENVENKFNKGVIYIIDGINSQISGIINFLLEKNIIQVGLGLIIASQITKITNALQNVIISPIIDRISVGEIKKLEDWKINLLGMELKIGLLLSTIINFILIIIIVYYIWRLSKMSNLNFINDFLESIKPKIKQS